MLGTSPGTKGSAMNRSMKLTFWWGRQTVNQSTNNTANVRQSWGLWWKIIRVRDWSKVTGAAICTGWPGKVSLKKHVSRDLRFPCRGNDKYKGFKQECAWLKDQCRWSVASKSNKDRKWDQRVNSQIMQGLTGHDKDFGFYFKCVGSPTNTRTQRKQHFRNLQK